MRLAASIFSLALLAALAAPAFAAPDSPIASKDGSTFTLEDMHLFFLGSLGNDGLVDFFQTMVVYQEGLKQGLKPTQAEINDFIDKQIGQDTYNQFKQLYSERAMHMYLEYTLVYDKYTKWLRDKILREQGITATPDEAKKYFLEHIDKFHLPEGVYISIISVESQSQADAVLKRLAAGENFNDVAGEVNMDPRMRATRGEFGLHRRGAKLQMNLTVPGGLTVQEFMAMFKPEALAMLTRPELPKPLEDAAFALKDGQYSGVIKVENYNIIYCHKHYPEVSPTFDEVKQDLMKNIVEAKIDPYYQQELSKLMDREMPRFTVIADLLKPEEPASGPPPAEKPAPAKPAPPAKGSGGGDAPKVGG